MEYGVTKGTLQHVPQRWDGAVWRRRCSPAALELDLIPEIEILKMVLLNLVRSHHTINLCLLEDTSLVVHKQIVQPVTPDGSKQRAGTAPNLWHMRLIKLE